MRKELLSLMLVMLSCMAAWSADGDTFTVKTSEKVDVTYEVIDENNSYCQVGFTYDKNIGVRTAIDQSTSGSITIPSVVNGYTVKHVASYAFSGCTKLTSIVIPDGVSYIGNSAFANCSNAVTISIPNSVSGNSFGNRTFAGCSNLTAINIPEGVTSIGPLAFRDCNSLKSVHLPSTVTILYEQAFYGCTKLSDITLSDNLVYIGTSAFSGCSITSLTLPHSFTTSYGINNISYSGSNIGSINTLNKVVINNGVSSLYDVFKYCPYVETVICYNDNPVNAYNCWQGAYYGTLYVPNGTKEKYKEDANWKIFNKIIEMDGVSDYSSIGDTFIDNGVIYKTTCPFPKEVQVGLRTGAIDKNTAGNLIIPTSVRNPQTNQNYSVTSINNYAFSSCKELVSVRISNGVTSIGEGAFYGCTSLSTVTIPRSVTSIGYEAFKSCNNLTCVICESNTPVNIDEYVFTNKANATLYVPSGSVAAYQAADYWKDFKEIVEIVDEITMSSNEICTYTSAYDLDFSGVSGLKAYIVSGFDPVNAKLVLTQVTDVPSGTGLLLKGAEGNYVVPHNTSSMVYSNLLKGVTATTEISPTDGDNTNFILANGKHGINFYTLNATGDIAAGKAYLQLPTASVSALSRGFTLVFDEESTGISTISSRNIETDKVYDLQGRHVVNPSKGLYIVNGKKKFIK